jgi:hypothetical protein
MGPEFTITVPWFVYAAFAAAVAALLAAAFWAGRLDRRDGRVLAGVRETNARFDQARALRERSRQRLTQTLSTLHALSMPVVDVDTKPRWVTPDAVHVLDAEPVPVPDDEREVEPDDDGYPRMRNAYGAGRLPVEVHGDEHLAVWPTNAPRPGLHRADLLEEPTRALPRAELEAVLADGAP